MKVKAILFGTLVFIAGAFGLSENVKAAELGEKIPYTEFKTGETLAENWELTNTRMGKPLILDMDFCTDVDDAAALRVAIALEDLGFIDLKAVSLCVKAPDNVNLQAANGMLNYYGKGDTPMGLSSRDIPDTSPYWDTLRKWVSPDMQIVPAVKLWRYIIENATEPVDIVTTGYLTNLADFAKSEPDEFSDKTGFELLAEKVGNIYIQGGSYPSGMDNNFWVIWDAKESLDWVLKNINKPLFFISNDAGAPVNCGGWLCMKDVEKKEHLTQAFAAWGSDYGRVAWDPMAVWIAGCMNNEVDLLQNGLALQRVNLLFDIVSGVNAFKDAPETGKYYRIYRTDNEYSKYEQILDGLTVYDGRGSVESGTAKGIDELNDGSEETERSSSEEEYISVSQSVRLQSK